MCDCLVLKQFIFCILTNLICWNFNVFVFSAVVPIHLTLHHSAMNTELNIVENLLLAKSFYFLFLPICFYISKVSKQRLVFGHFWLFSQNNQPTLDWKLKNDWTKRLQKIQRKINLSLSLAKRKLAEKNERNFSNQSVEVTHASIYLTNCRRSFIFSVYLI